MRGKKARELRKVITNYKIFDFRLRRLEYQAGVQPKRKWWQIWL